MKNSLKISKEIDKNDIANRYEYAQNIMQGIWTDKIVFNDRVYPIWIGESDCFWYERTTKLEQGDASYFGKEYRLVNANAATNKPAFNHPIFAEALAKASSQNVNAFDLPIKSVEIGMEPLVVEFSAFDKRWKYSDQSKICVEIETLKEGWIISPDGTQAVFARDYNLFITNLTNGDERALTTDGEEYFVYGAMDTAWGKAISPPTDLQVRWSPDSRRLFAIQRDTRLVKSTPIVHHVPKDGSLRPTVEKIKVAYPGDENIETLRLLVIDTEKNEVLEADYRHIPVTRNGDGFFRSNRGWWGKDSDVVYFIDMERDYQAVRLVSFDILSGATRILFEETSDTHINLMHDNDDRPAFMPLPESNELLWFSERSGWAHLYLYDLANGQLKKAVTKGDWLVRDVIAFDAVRREVFLQTAGRSVNNENIQTAEIDPYYLDLVRVNVDTGYIATIVSGDYNFLTTCPKRSDSIVVEELFGLDIGSSNGVSPTGNFCVVTRGRADIPCVSELVDRNGIKVLVVEEANLSGLPDDWQWPEPVKLLAADGKTDIYGLVYRPSNFSPNLSYPVISHVFNNAEMPFVSKGSFNNGVIAGYGYYDAAALAQLGFIVVQVDGRGTPCRSKSFYTESYGKAQCASNIDDHVAAIKQLSKQYPYIDTNRAGITAHFAGGTGAVFGLLQYPEFYKVGVNSSLLDQRFVSASMSGDKYNGLNHQALGNELPEECAQNLRGKLLLIHGLLNWCCAASGTFRLVEALQKANKDFDMLVLPNHGHEMSNNYLTRRTWDYLVENLLKIQPPKEFNLTFSAGGSELNSSD